MGGACHSSYVSTGSVVSYEHGWESPRAPTTVLRWERLTSEGARRFPSIGLSSFVCRVEPSLQNKQRCQRAGGNRSRATHADFGPGDPQDMFTSHDSVRGATGLGGRASRMPLTTLQGTDGTTGPSTDLSSWEVSRRVAESGLSTFLQESLRATSWAITH